MDFIKQHKTILGVAILLLISVAGVSFMTQKDSKMEAEDVQPSEVAVPEGQEIATFATGCFWCMEATFQETEGVTDAVSGYGGGTEPNPTYEEVYTHQTSHRESVQVTYDPNIISYNELLDIFWRGIDPTDPDGQFVDRGFSYTTAVFYHNNEQKQQAEASKKELEESNRFDKQIVTPILPYTTFYEAEEYHQDFYKKSKDRYKQYSANSGRDEFREQIWKEIQKEQ